MARLPLQEKLGRRVGFLGECAASRRSFAARLVSFERKGNKRETQGTKGDKRETKGDKR